MRNLFHVCNKSAKAIFRSEYDIIMAINRIANFAKNTDSQVFAFSVLSTHIHILIYTDNVKEFMRLFSISYTKLFNSRYNTSGKILHMKGRCLSTESEILIGLNYVLTNSFHHAVAEHPLSYRYCSINCYFNTAFSSQDHPNEVRNNIYYDEYRHLLSRNFNKIGINILPNNCVKLSDFINIAAVENIYKSPRAFLYNINRALGEEYIKNQFHDFSGGAILEKNSVYRYGKRILDFDICEFIDEHIDFPNSGRSFKQLTDKESNYIKQYFLSKGVSEFQIERCL